MLIIPRNSLIFRLLVDSNPTSLTIFFHFHRLLWMLRVS
jgi:hypothetical protein